MNQKKSILMAMTLLAAVLISACGGGAPAPTEAAPAPVQNPPTEAPPPVVVEPTVAPAEPAAPAFAPACAAVASCPALEVADKPAYETYCVQKVPYQNLLLPAGTVLEPQPKAGDPEFYPLVCADSGTKSGGLNVFSCRGAELWSYDLKVTSAGCPALNLQAGTSNCAEGQGYDAVNNCCAPLGGGEAGSVLIKVNMGACPSQ